MARSPGLPWRLHASWSTTAHRRRIADNPKGPLVRTIGRGAAAYARTHATDDACRIIVDRCSSGRRHHTRTKRLEPARLRRRSEPQTPQIIPLRVTSDILRAGAAGTSPA